MQDVLDAVDKERLIYAGPMGRSIESLMYDARSWLRDFPTYFTATSPAVGQANRTIELPHRNVSIGGLVTWATDGTTSWQGALDDHETVSPPTTTATCSMSAMG